MRAAEMLTCKERVGVLDDPLLGTDPDREQALLAGPATAYRELAQASVVLLRPTRPDPAVLPIPTAADGVRLCVLGPLAHQDPEDWLGAYSSHANRHLDRVTTPLKGIRKHWPEAAYARGCDYDLDRGGDRRAASGSCARRRPRRRWPAGRRTSCSSSASRTSGAVSRPRWPIRGCPISSAGSCSSCAGPIRRRS